MFTGIIEALAKVEDITQGEGNMRMQLSSQLSAGLKPGQSLAHDGVCLTIESVEADRHWVSVIPETLKKTSLGHLRPGARVNLERSLAVGKGVEGHFVQGHVDSTGSLVEIKKVKGDAGIESEIEITVACPSMYKDLVVAQGSIALHGISLTLSSVGQAENPEQCLFSVCIIPHTYENTNVSTWQKASFLNIEFDILGKYVRNMLHSRLGIGT